MQSRVFLKGFAMESLFYDAEVFGLARHSAGFSMRADWITRGGTGLFLGQILGQNKRKTAGKWGVKVEIHIVNVLRQPFGGADLGGFG